MNWKLIASIVVALIVLSIAVPIILWSVGSESGGGTVTPVPSKSP